MYWLMYWKEQKQKHLKQIFKELKLLYTDRLQFSKVPDLDE